MITDMKGISRIDSKHTHGWFVRVYRDGKAIGKFFSDGVHGGRDEALQKARQHKIDYDLENPPSPFQGRVRMKPQKNNKTGVLGISETYETWRNGRKVPCFSVSWRPAPNIAKNKRFYIHHYESKQAALEAAAKFREERIADLAKELTADANNIPKASTAKKDIAQKTVTKKRASTKKSTANKAIKSVSAKTDKPATKREATRKKSTPMELMLSVLKSRR